MDFDVAWPLRFVPPFQTNALPLSQLTSIFCLSLRGYIGLENRPMTVYAMSLSRCSTTHVLTQIAGLFFFRNFDVLKRSLLKILLGKVNVAKLQVSTCMGM